MSPSPTAISVPDSDASAATVTLCGPQRLKPTITDLAPKLAQNRPIGLVTAGWREREKDDNELQTALGNNAVNLRLYTRWKTIAADDPDYFELHRQRQDKLRRLQVIYRRRLNHAMAAARELLAHDADDDLYGPEQVAAIAAIAELDRHHLRRVKAIHLDFQQTVKPGTRPSIARHREQVAHALEGVRLVCIAGGHVAVLLNRLRLFALRSLLVDRHVMAWSAGAMAMTSRVVLFHDFPPWGDGDAEVLDHGLGLVDDVVALPHAHRRLDLEDNGRVALMARRMNPARCVILPDGAHAAFAASEVLDTSHDLRLLSAAGTVDPAEVS